MSLRTNETAARNTAFEIQRYLKEHEQDYLPVLYLVTETLGGEVWLFVELNPLLDGFFRPERVEELSAQLNQNPVYLCRQDGFHLAVLL